MQTELWMTDYISMNFSDINSENVDWIKMGLKTI
jgi:hypothetical protein